MQMRKQSDQFGKHFRKDSTMMMDSPVRKNKKMLVLKPRKSASRNSGSPNPGHNKITIKTTFLESSTHNVQVNVEQSLGTSISESKEDSLTQKNKDINVQVDHNTSIVLPPRQFEKQYEDSIGEQTPLLP